MKVSRESILLFLSIFELGFSGWFKKNALYDAKLPAGSKLIALTFDDGPHGTLTPRLLDIFKEKKMKATFFVMGIKVGLHPDIVKRAQDEGHEIANHVWNHPVLSKLSLPDVSSQLVTTNAAIQSATGSVPLVMRPPYGNTNDKLNKYIEDEGKLKVIMWSLDTQDWKRPPSQNIVTRTVKRVKSGDVILCHDIHPGTIEAMPRLVDELLKLGYQFVTVSEILAHDIRSTGATATLAVATAITTATSGAAAAAAAGVARGAAGATGLIGAAVESAGGATMKASSAKEITTATKTATTARTKHHHPATAAAAAKAKYLRGTPL